MSAMGWWDDVLGEEFLRGNLESSPDITRPENIISGEQQ